MDTPQHRRGGAQHIQIMNDHGLVLKPMVFVVATYRTDEADGGLGMGWVVLHVMENHNPKSE